MPGDSTRPTTSKPRESSFDRRSMIKTIGTGGIAALTGCLDDLGSDTSPSGSDTTTGTTRNGETTIEYWRWQHSSDVKENLENKFVEEFNKKDNGVTVKQVTAPSANYSTKLKTAIGGKSAPAVGWKLNISSLYSPVGKSRKEIENNAPYAYLDSYLDDSFVNQFWDPYWTSMFSDFKGIVGVPFIGEMSPGLVYVNRDAWDKAGLGELPSETWSYEEFHQSIEAINGTKVGGSEVNGLAVGLKDAARTWWIHERKSKTAGKIIGEGFQNKSGSYEVTLADDKMTEAWDAWYTTPVENGWTTEPLSYGISSLVQPFYQGNIGLMPSEIWARVPIASNAEFNWDIVPYPTKNEEDFWLREGSAIPMTAFKEELGGNPEAAAKFLQFRNNAENQFRFFNKTGTAVPNQEAFKMAQNESLSDTVKDTKAMVVMEQMNAAYEGMKDYPQKVKNRYPSVKSRQTRGETVVSQGMPIGAAGGKLTQSFKTQLQRSVKNKATKAAFTDIEKEWQTALNGAGPTVAEDSIGYNSP